VIVLPFLFEGGDALFTDDEIYLGYACADKEDKVALAQKTLGEKRVVILGDKDVSSPFPHLDSAVVFASNEVALVSNPKRLFDILSSLSRDELREWQQRFARKLQDREKHSAPGKTTTQISGEIIRDIGFVNSPGKYGYDAIRRGLERETRMMDKIKEQLEAEGKRVVELPGMTVMGFPFSPVNSLIDSWKDEGKTKRRIFLATFGLEKLDSEVLANLNESGLFTSVVPIEVGWELALSRGGIRCVVNALRRPD